MRNIIVASSVLVVLSGCSSVDNFVDTTNSINYKNSQSTKTLDFPPDLTAPEFDSAFALPSGGSVTASAVNNQSQSRSGVAGADNVLPTSADMRMGVSGNVRWLEVDAAANTLWPQIRNFWRTLGVQVKRDEPRVGIMETDWAENRAGLPMDWLRKALGKTFQGTFDAGTRDQYRVRLERPSANKTKIYLSHKGAEQMVTDTGVFWQLRPSKPELEAEMLNRLQAFLQGDKYSATKNTSESDAVQTSSQVNLVSEDGSYILKVGEAYPKAWVRTGIMLDRMGLVVESRNQGKGFLNVVYSGDESVENTGGFFSRMFKGKTTFLAKSSKYQIHMRDAGRMTEIRVMDEDGEPLAAAESQRILARLKQEFDR